MRLIRSEPFTDVPGLMAAYRGVRDQAMQDLGIPESLLPSLRVAPEGLVLCVLREGQAIPLLSGSVWDMRDAVLTRRENFQISFAY